MDDFLMEVSVSSLSYADDTVVLPSSPCLGQVFFFMRLRAQTF